jgi:site-specific recombinase XerD
MIWSYNQGFVDWEGLIKCKPIGNIRRADVKAFADFLRDKPNARGGGLNYKSIERSLGHIKNFMAWAVAAGHVENDHFGDVKGRDRTREERMAPDSRRAFTAAELQKLFSSRLFREPKNETRKGGGLVSGGRRDDRRTDGRDRRRTRRTRQAG